MSTHQPLRDCYSYLDQALPHALRRRLDEDAQGGVEVLNGDGPHEASFLLLPQVPVSTNS